MKSGSTQDRVFKLILELLSTGQEAQFLESLNELLEADASVDLNIEIPPENKNLYSILTEGKNDELIFELKKLQQKYHFKFSAPPEAPKEFKIPDYFYYSKETSKETLSSTPSAKPDIQAFFRGGSKWFLHEGAVEKAPKKIIICAESVRQAFLHNSNLYDYFKKLLKEKFELYVFNEDEELIKVNEGFLSSLLYIQKCSEEYDSKKLEKMTAARGVSKDSILIFDSEKVKNLTSELGQGESMEICELSFQKMLEGKEKKEFSMQAIKITESNVERPIGMTFREFLEITSALSESVKKALSNVIFLEGFLDEFTRYNSLEIISSPGMRWKRVLVCLKDRPEIKGIVNLDFSKILNEIDSDVEIPKNNLEYIGFECESMQSLEKCLGKINELLLKSSQRDSCKIDISFKRYFSFMNSTDLELELLYREGGSYPSEFEKKKKQLKVLLLPFQDNLTEASKARVRRLIEDQNSDIELKMAFKRELERYAKKEKDEIRYHRGDSLGSGDTERKDASFNVKRIFFGKDGEKDPSVNLYRINVYSVIKLHGKDQFIRERAEIYLEDLKEPILADNEKEVLKEKIANTRNYYGKFELPPGDDWQVIPSLLPQEKITKLYAERKKVEVKYEKKSKLYYIRNKSKEAINICFNLSVPKELPGSVPEEIKKMVKYFNDFEPFGELRNTDENVLERIYKQRIGACRHRAPAFAYKINELYGDKYPVRVITNQIHEFVEVFINGKWVIFDLGGAPVDLKVSDENRPNIERDEKEKKEKERKEEAREEAKEELLDEEAAIERLEKGYEKYFIEEKERTFGSLIEFNQAILSSEQEGKNILLTMPKNKTLDYEFELKKYCRNTRRPFYYINSPEDLKCAANWIERQEDNTGVSRKGPGGEFYNFLMENKDKNLVIVVNWNNFSASEIVKFNGLIDQERFADGTEVPKRAEIIGLYDSEDPDAYQGQDFFSRFSEKKKLPSGVLSDVKSQYIPEIKKIEEIKKGQDLVEIDLYSSNDWRNMLIGEWNLNGKNLFFKEGPWIEAIKKGKRILIKNPPRESEDFRLFLENYFLEHGNLNNIEFVEGYEWSKLNKQIEWIPLQQKPDEEIFVLNAGSVGYFFKTYHIEKGEFSSEKGILEANRGKTLFVEITGDLSAQKWCQLLSLAEKFHVKLNVFSKRDLLLPEGMKQPEIFSEDESLCYKDFAKVILSTDPDASVQIIKKVEPAVMVVDVSELSGADVLKRIKAKWYEEVPQFSKKTSDVLKALKEGQHVVLKGKFSQELVDSLSEWMVGNHKVKGKLTLVSDNKEPFKYIPSVTENITVAEKIKLLNEQYGAENVQKLGSKVEILSFVELQSRLNFLRENPDKNPDELWMGLSHVPLASRRGDISFDIKDAEAFEKARLDKILSVIEKEPYVFIAGATGVGKSTFIDTVLKQQCNAVYHEKINLKAWAENKTPGYKILFIDEANIDDTEYSMFEGLYDDPPWILLNGKIKELTPEHKVIFAGNPLSYGGERRLPSFFERHGNSIIFDPLPPAYLYHKVLKPIFEGQNEFDEKAIQILSKVFLLTYQMIVELSPNKILMSPRELQMMALLVMAKKGDKRWNTFYAAYEIGRQVLPEDLKEYFEKMFKAQFPFFNKTEKSEDKIVIESKKGKDFVLTPSRHEIYEKLEDLLAIRKYQRSEDAQNDASRYGGLGGMVLEGEPGTGKSHFVTAVLVNNGFIKGDPNSDEELGEKDIFYVIPSSYSQREKERVLLKAFHEGAIVIIDEINACGEMEKLMNTLLMGLDEEKRRPTRPGFKLIGTENPITYSGRKARSLALQRRLIKAEFSDYRRSEVIDILRSKGLTEEEATALANVYFRKREKALIAHQTPPVFRELCKVVETLVAARMQDKAKEKEEEKVEVKVEIKGLGKEPDQGRRQVVVFASKGAISQQAPEKQVETVLPKLREDEMIQLQAALGENTWGVLDVLERIFFEKDTRILKISLTADEKEKILKFIYQFRERNADKIVALSPMLNSLEQAPVVLPSLTDEKFQEAVNLFQKGKHAGLDYVFDGKFNLIVSLTPAQRDELILVLEPLSEGNQYFSNALAALQPSGPSKPKPAS